MASQTAAGSLFTSCVTNTEPQGIRDLREAKADYLASLSKLREADAELVKAKAALKQAEAATEQAVAAYNQAIAEAKQIENEIQKARNEKEAEELKAQIDSIIAKAEQDAVDAQKTLAQKQDELEKYLREIAAKSFGLTREEEQAIKTKTATLNIAYRNYNQKLNAYNIAAFQLWDAEYNVSAGVEGYETAESYKDSIAKYEEKIADANEDIASLEALKEHPQAVKDSLDVLDAQIAAIEEQIFLSQSDKVLYESTPEFADAKKEFAKRVADFVADSLKNAASDFVYADKKGNAVKYPLTNGKGLDQDFKLYVNKAVKDKNNKTASQYGIAVEDEENPKNIEVGKIGSDYASKKQLDSAQAILKEIIAALDRHLVVVNDSVEAKKYEGLVKAANEAKKAYINDRDTLEKGLAAYAPYKAANDTVKMYQDTVKKAQADSLAAEKKLKADSVTIVTDAKTLAQNYHDAIKNFSDQAALFAVKAASEKDTTGFLSAVNALGSTQAAYLNLQDSVLVEKKAKLGTQEVTYTEYVSFSSLTKATFKAIYQAGSDQHFAKVLSAANCNTAEGGISNKKIAENVGPKQKIIGVYDGKAFVYKVTEKDTVNWLKTNFNFANQTFEKDKAAVEAAKEAVNDANKKLDAKKELAQKAQNAFAKVYYRFWGIDDTPKLQGAKEEPFPLCKSLKKWTDSTFFSPENCVKFKHEGEGVETILPNNTLQIVLDRVDSEDNAYSQGKDVNESSIFKNNKLTEFAEYILAAQYADEASNYKFLEEQFENIKAQVAAIKKDVDAAYAAWEEANKGLAAVKARFYGVGKDGKILNPKSEVLEEVNTDNGKWAFGGYLLKWAEELAPEYPAIVKEATTKVAEIREDQDNLIRYRFTLDMIFTIYSDFFENPDYAAWNVEGIIKLLDEDIKTLKADIKVYENRIEALNKSVAECEAGYSNAEIKVNYWKSVLAQTERALEQAEEALARAQKEYDEVIAAYGVKDAE